MAICQTFVHSIIFIVSAIQATSSPKHVTIDAAFVYSIGPPIIMFFQNDEALYVPLEKIEDYPIYEEAALVNSSYFAPMRLTAGTMRNVDNETEAFFFGENDMIVHSTYHEDAETIEYESDYQFVMDGGPDAVTKRGDELIFFKGCKMAVRLNSGEWEEPEDVKSLGLPCHVDAAWDENKTSIILRGDQIWKWKEDGTVDGPHPFHEIYTLHSWILIPYVEPSCPQGWHLYEDLNMCYRLFHEKKTWSAARTACQTEGGDLVTIKDKDTLEYVNDLVKVDYAFYWLGLNDVKKEGTFVWLDETEKATFTHWNSIEPNDYHGEDCVHITENTKFLWNDLGCEAEIGYICQLSATKR